MSAFVMIGAGEAGVRAAFTLRQQGCLEPIVLIGAEPGLPYEKPPLSKSSLLTPDVQPTLIASEAQWVEANIDYRSGVSVTLIDKETRQVTLSSGEQIAYDKLLIATGARARRLDFDGVDPEKVLTLRTWADAQQIRAKAQAGQRAVLIGAGFIGLELAATLKQIGLEVTVLEAQARILQRAVPAQVAEILAQNQLDHGVDLRTECRIESVRQEGESLTIDLQSYDLQSYDHKNSDHQKSTSLRADFLVVGIGSIPNTQLGEMAGLDVENGICVDATLQTSNEHIYAAGDVCRFPHGLYGNEQVRLESWRCAQEQGEIAAQNMLGANLAYTQAPWFWSDQFDLGLQMVGLSFGVATTVVRELGARSRLVLQIGGNGQLLSACGVGEGNSIAKDIKIAERLIQAQAVIPATELADSNVKLKALLKRL